MYFLIKAYIFQKLEEFIFYLHSDIVFIFCRVMEKATKTNKQTNKQTNKNVKRSAHFILYATVSPFDQIVFK